MSRRLSPPEYEDHVRPHSGLTDHRGCDPVLGGGGPGVRLQPGVSANQNPGQGGEGGQPPAGVRGRGVLGHGDCGG